MLTRTKVLENLQNLPENFSFDELMDRLSILHKFELGQEQSRDSELISDDNLDENLGTWLA